MFYENLPKGVVMTESELRKKACEILIPESRQSWDSHRIP